MHLWPKCSGPVGCDNLCIGTYQSTICRIKEEWFSDSDCQLRLLVTQLRFSNSPRMGKEQKRLGVIFYPWPCFCQVNNPATSPDFAICAQRRIQILGSRCGNTT